MTRRLAALLISWPCPGFGTDHLQMYRQRGRHMISNSRVDKNCKAIVTGRKTRHAGGAGSAGATPPAITWGGQSDARRLPEG